MEKLRSLAYIVSFSCLLVIAIISGVNSFLSHSKMQSLITEIDSVKSENYALHSKINTQEALLNAEKEALNFREETSSNIKRNTEEALKLLENMKGEGKDEEVKRFLSTPIPDSIRSLLNN